MEEMLARIESNLRRAQLKAAPFSLLKYKNLTLDTDKTTAHLKGRELLLTAKEFAILELLMKYPDKVFSKANLFQSVWNAEYFSGNKLKAVCPDEDYIDTVWGIGYRLHRAGG